VTGARHVIFGTGAIGLATLDALRRRGETVRLVNRSGHARLPDGTGDDIEVAGGDARDPAFTTAAAHGAAVICQTLNPPYDQWTAQWPALQAGVLAAAEATGARLVSMENVSSRIGTNTAHRRSANQPQRAPRPERRERGADR
jgi:uncharacterized protein YbjT (DUF2867 family)